MGRCMKAETEGTDTSTICPDIWAKSLREVELLVEARTIRSGGESF